MENSDEESVKAEIVDLDKTAAIFDLEEDETTVKSRRFPSIHSKSSVLKGIIQSLPLVIGYLPVATAYGILAQDIGLSFLATVLMSFIVYAGSAQFIAISMMATGQTVLSIVLTTFIVNMRHLLFSTSIAPYLSQWKLWQRILFGAELTDEAFAFHSTRYQEHKPHFSQDVATNITTQFSWIAGSALGYGAGSLFTDIKVFGLDFALPAMFIALLIIFLKNRWMIYVSLITGGITLLLIVYGYKTWAVILAASLGATIGMALELWKTRRSS